MSKIDRFPKKPCKFCGGSGHFSYLCRYNPKNKDRQYTSIKKTGKYAKQWTITRKTWIRNNPPDQYGNWYCYLQIHPWCPLKLDARTLTLDHVESRSHAPDKRFKADNLRPACIYCNNMKGSRKLEQVRAEVVK